MLPLLAKVAKKRKQKAEESLDCFPPRFARGRNDGDSNRLFQQPARAFSTKIQAPETLYLLVFIAFSSINRQPLDRKML